MAIEMGIFFQPGIAMRGQHLSVGIYLDPFALALFEEFFQVFQIMAGDQYGFALLNSQRNLGRHGMTIGSRIGGVEEFHGSKINLSAFEYEFYPIIQAQVFPQTGSQPFVDEGINLFILLPRIWAWSA